MKPILRSEAFRNKRSLQSGNFVKNPFSMLRDNSPAPTAKGEFFRDRSPSIKRKNSQEASYAEIAGTGASAPTSNNSIAAVRREATTAKRATTSKGTTATPREMTSPGGATPPPGGHQH